MRKIVAKIGDKEFELYVAKSEKGGFVGNFITSLLQMRGLIGRNIKENEGMLFPHEKMFYPIHTYFMKYPIDLIYLNENKEVIEICRNLKPFKTYYPQKKSCYLIEIKHNPNLKIKEGDVIYFEEG